MDSKSSTYHVGDLAKSLGLSARSIRYYEELGLIRPSRTEGGFRLYTDQDKELIMLIVRFKDLGMSLEEIRALVAPKRSISKESLEELRQTLLLRRSEFEEKIGKLKQSIEQIDNVVEQLSRCERCGVPMQKDACNECIKSHGEEVSPLLDQLR